MDYDNDLAFAVECYRKMQKALPGADALYRLVLAQLEHSLDAQAHILVAGAGGGREIETLGASSRAFTITGFDPSEEMLRIARHYRELSSAKNRTGLVKGTISDLEAPGAGFDAATSLLVMHFFPDEPGPDGKLAYLRAIRQRIRPGAVFLLADVSYEDEAAFDAMEPVFLRHAELAGLHHDVVASAPATIKAMPTISGSRTAELFGETGFSPPKLFFQTLWYRGWTATAV
ncbi:class I SAM-dependent methyltransferase [Alterisphingorhabdus coralli]|uniref:Class I SAM-dependent methyltransferase n=1 Tax=Alterisphingorhabdus coralli TaxID=3071408 RepID=A0AA97I2G6_9SPHN|nr:class I SAM-dependent methyltransferase [Parasphingorhabdus sp. SCSIO 66989]WOE76380.1 class I SAM-dependent methyltransferase [Parasphingorhabdus sp. SCSIO 66989]